MKKLTRGILTAAVVGGIVAGPTSASAALRLYADNNYGALIATHTTTGWWNLWPGPNDDTLQSVKNQTPYGAAFWHDPNRAGACFSYGAYTDDPSFWWKDRDEVSSYGLGWGC